MYNIIYLYFSEDEMSSSDSDCSDGVPAVVNFHDLARVKESVSFTDEAESLSVNDYQGIYIL